MIRIIPPISGLPSQYNSRLVSRPLLFPFPFFMTNQKDSKSLKKEKKNPHELLKESFINQEVDQQKLLIESLYNFSKSLKIKPKDIFESNDNNNNNKDNEGDDSNDEKESESKNSKERTFEMILTIIERSVYFLSTNDINAQVRELEFIGYQVFF